MGVAPNGWCIMENSIYKCMIWGYPHDLGNLHMYTTCKIPHDLGNLHMYIYDM